LITAVTADEMRDAERVAVEDVGLRLLQIMENAGRTLAGHVADVAEGTIVVVAGSGGNGGGGMVCARHLANRGRSVRVLLGRDPGALDGAATVQHDILAAMDVPVATTLDAMAPPPASATVVDALVGYGLSGPLRTPADDYVDWMNARDGAVVSLDVPSGRDATTGEVSGDAVGPDRTVTLALPKTGLADLPGRLLLADISIPATVYDRLDIAYTDPFGDCDWVELETAPGASGSPSGSATRRS
jgi:NAD(P)H-hydrate epimerase